MARFWLHRLYAVLYIVSVANHSVMAKAIVESNEARTKRIRRDKGDDEADDIRSLMKKLEDKIDDADVRRMIMEAQMQSPLDIPQANKIEAALRYIMDIIDTKNPSNTQRNWTVMSKNGIFLQIFKDGTVNGSKNGDSPNNKLAIEVVGFGGAYRIRGEKSQMYLMCRKNGRIEAMLKKDIPKNLVIESVFINEPVYSNRNKGNKKRYEGEAINCMANNGTYYLGFRRSLKLKKANRVDPAHRGSHFFLKSSGL